MFSSRSQNCVFCYEMFGINLLLRCDKLQPKLKMICSISDHPVLFFSKRRLYLADILIKPSPPKTPNDHCGRGHKQQDDTKATCKVISWICTMPTKHTSLQYTKWNIKCWCSASWEGGFLTAKYLYSPEILTIQQIMKHIKQRKLKFTNVFILVNILSVLNCLPPIFLPWK